MEKELLETFETAKKAADAAKVAADHGAPSDSDESRCIDALKRLRDIPVSMKDLVSTQVGKRLRYLTKHQSQKIQAVASDVLEGWKNVVIEETAKNNRKNGYSDNKHSMKVEIKSEKSEIVKVEKFAKAEKMKTEKVTTSKIVEVEKIEKGELIKTQKVMRPESVKGEKIPKEEKHKVVIGPPKLTSMIKCNDSVRDKFREILAEALTKVSSEADEDLIDEVNECDPIRAAVSLESVMYEKLGRSNGAQKFKYRSIMFNLKDANNPDLRRRVLLGQIEPERLIDMTPEEMASDQRKRENNQIKEKALFDCERSGAPKATTDQFKCGRCGQRKTTYYQLQTRSADEPMTTFVTCVNCNNHWKFC